MRTSALLTALLIVMPVPAGYAEDLQTIYQQALEADPQLKTAALRVEIGSAQKGQALGEMLPQVSASGNWSVNDQRIKNAGSDSYHGTRYFVSLSQTLIDFAKFWNWRRAAEVKHQYEAEHTEARHTLMFNVVDRYFGVLEAEDQLYFLQRQKALTQKQLQQVQKQYAKQLIKITGLYEVEARLDKITADEIEAESILVTAKESLRELTNTMPQRLQKLREQINYQELEGPLEQWLEVAKSENPTLSALLSAIEAAHDDVAVQKSRYLPVVDLQLNYYNTNTGYQSAQIPELETQVAAVNVNVPIFTGGTTTHRLFEAQHRLEISKEELEAQVRALIKETSDSFLTSNANVRRIMASRKALESAVKSREAMERAFHYGVATVREVLEAQEDEYLAERNLSQAKYSYIKNRIRFLRAIGMISDENIREVNDWLEITPEQPQQSSVSANEAS
ncbi:TolC family outer membrane protein [Methylobacter sp. Wu1]|uniref:TolC family outer membrane protein n=1 Tax=Methylobacter sp. Wu1 TaxID=3119359 RepID=UPI002F938589